MNKFIFSILIFIFSACAPAETKVVTSATPTISPTITYTSTPNITALPTIPSFTPTFDVSTMVTITPVEKAECPIENPDLAPTFYVPKFPGCFDTDYCVFSGTEKEILEFLNNGGTIQAAIAKLKTAIYEDYQDYAYQDLTGDQILDLTFIDFSHQKRMHIIYCSNEIYEVFTSEKDPYGSDQMVWKPIIRDMNNNGLPEVLFFQAIGIGCCKIFTLEWNGATFQDLSPNGFTQIEPQIKDIDNNGLLEIIGGANTEVYPVGLNRFETIVFSWNGKTYELVKESFPSPTFRIQAVYDGDWETLNKDFEKPLNSYQIVINDLSLESWSDEKSLYQFRNWESRGATILTDPTPLPNLTEYPQLASYAYYRIILLQLAQSQTEEANKTYQTLQDTFGNDVYAKPYIEMTNAFLQAYQVNQRMYDGCAAAIQYAVEHPEILVPLGSDYHGSQAKIYTPEDVCPFR